MKKEANVLKEFAKKLTGANIREARAVFEAAEKDSANATRRLNKFLTWAENRKPDPEKFNLDKFERAGKRLREAATEAQFRRGTAKTRKEDAVMDTAGAWGMTLPAVVGAGALGKAALNRNKK